MIFLVSLLVVMFEDLIYFILEKCKVVQVTIKIVAFDDKNWLNNLRLIITCLKCVWARLYRDGKVMKGSNNSDLPD